MRYGAFLCTLLVVAVIAIPVCASAQQIVPGANGNFSTSFDAHPSTTHLSSGFRFSDPVLGDLGFITGANSDVAKVISFRNPQFATTQPAPFRRSRFAIKQSAQYGVASRSEGSDKPGEADNPIAAEEEAYLNRAYPAPFVPMAVTENAQSAWTKVKGRSVAKGKVAPGAWSLVGPSTANFPDVLTFSGASYTTSGRITALAIAPNCTPSNCRLWAAAAGGGVWRTDNALSGNGASWTFVSGAFATNAIGTLTYDAATGTLYAGTGEANASADSEAGFGIYKSTDGGSSWTKLAGNTSVPAMPTTCGDAPAYSGPAFNGRAISSIVINGGTIYVGSTRAVRGVSSVTSGGTASLAPGLPPFGIWSSADGGATFTLLNATGVCLNAALAGDAGKIQSSFGSARGVNHIEVDPTSPSTVYAANFPRADLSGGGVWRSVDNGTTWAQIKTAHSANASDRAEFAVAKLPDGKTRMYVGDGADGNAPPARFWRSDDVATGLPVFTNLTTTQNTDYCTGQCWYDNFVISPAGFPDTVYLGGSFQYGEYGGRSNGRGVLYSTDAGASFTDMTWDATTGSTPPGSCCQPNPIAPNGLHPDQHALVVSSSNPGLFFEGSDGGLMRSSGSFADISGQCASRGLGSASLALCQQLLSRVPTQLFNLNKGLSTLQFQSLSVAADNPKHLQGGTQDNGTFETTGSAVVWPQIIYGDGGQSGFSATNSAMRFNTFTGQANDVNFQNGDPTKWVIATGPIVSSPEGSQFYPPVIADPSAAAAGTIFQGSNSVWRTQDWGGDQAFLEAHCPEFTTSAANPNCGDFVPIGPSGSTSLTGVGGFRGSTRSGGNVAAIQRRANDTTTLWAATTTGRVFISTNADAPASSVTYTRLDSLAANSPARFVSGISIDPANPNHAWISYSGYTALTPATPGHVFSVTYNPTDGTATWTSLDGSGATGFPDFPATSIARDTNGDLYVSNDWGVLMLPHGTTAWVPAGTGLPMVEVAGLTIVPNARLLYAATHGRSAWVLKLP